MHEHQHQRGPIIPQLPQLPQLRQRNTKTVQARSLSFPTHTLSALAHPLQNPPSHRSPASQTPASSSGRLQGPGRNASHDRHWDWGEVTFPLSTFRHSLFLPFRHFDISLLWGRLDLTTSRSVGDAFMTSFFSCFRHCIWCFLQHFFTIPLIHFFFPGWRRRGFCIKDGDKHGVRTGE